MSNLLDPLTGLRNHEAFELELKQTVTREESAALALIDVDRFGEVNERYGHGAGDKVLTVIADIMKETVSEGTAYRVSGDEFAVLLSGCSLEQAFLRMEQLRAAVFAAQDRYRSDTSLDADISVTIGVAQYPRDAKDDPSLKRTADAALGSAKESGRNQVALPPNEEMVMKSCYYPATLVRRLKSLADKLKKKESILLREALSDLLRKYDRLEEN